MKTITILFFLMLMMTETFFSQAPPIETGVSQALAKWRAANYSDVRYKLNITLEKGAPLMTGTIEISVKLTEEGAKNDLILDWRTTQFANDKDKSFAEVVKVNEQIVKDTVQNGVFDYQINKEHLIVSKKYLKTGENVLQIKFASPIKSSGAAVTRYLDKEDGAEYVYSLFVPSDASTAFPVFDQPDLKARFSLTVVAEAGKGVVSNEKIALAVTGDGPNQVVTFAETKPISTYVFAFAAGEFAEFSDESDKGGNATVKERVTSQTSSKNTLPDGRVSASKIYVRKSQAEKFKQHAAEVFRLNRESIKFLEDWFDYKFPFPKYDLVLIPEFPFGGMEHAGATFLREDRVIFPTEPTKNDYITRANVIFHEAAHQWFGDTVTMKWFDDLWLKEGFAEFMAYKTLEKVLPEYNAWKVFYERNKQAAYLTDVTRGTTPIYQEIPNLASAKSAYGNIVYRKAPSFLRQAEFYLGEKEFQTAVRAFLKKHEFANAEWTDLVKEFENAWLDRPFTPAFTNDSEKKNYESEIKRIIQEWADSWIKKPSVEVFYIRPSSNKDNFPWIMRKFDSNDKTNFRSQTIKVLFGFADGKRNPKDAIKVDLGEFNYGAGLPLDFWRENESPTFIFPNYQDYGYGIFLLDEKSRAYVLANIQNEKDDFLRSMMWGSLWDAVRFYELAPEDYVKLVIKNINVETDESTIQTLLGRVSTAMNYYIDEGGNATVRERVNNAKGKNTLPEPSRVSASDLSAKIESVLLDKIANAATIGQRITFYRAFLNLASSENARKVLKDILAGKSKVAVFQLRTKDKFDIVTRLLILGDADAPALLANLEKTETSDEAKRYAYAARAGIGTAENKAKYFRDFLTNKDLSESWIEAAFVPFNSPKHWDLTSIYLETALAELPNLKKNRKIFFINGWLGAFIGGQRSEESLAIVNRFLVDNPNLDKDLRLKILENADNLERAVKIRAKYGK